MTLLDPLDLNLRHLRAFCEVVACGSISDAAATVHLSQSAITQAIAKLEVTLGARLFSRTSTGMLPTEAGRLMSKRTLRALDQISRGAIAARAAALGGKTDGSRGFERLITGAQLRALVAVAKTQNFTLAARQVGISQPSLHRLARDLERIAGVVFYNKTQQGIAVTQAARDLARHAQLALSEIRQALEELAALRGENLGILRVGALPLARTTILPRAINALSNVQPETKVRIVDGPYDDLLHELRHGGIDVLIGALRTPPPIDDIVQTPMFDDWLSVVSRRGHPLTKKRRPNVRDLASYPWIAPRPGAPSRAYFDALFKKSRLVAREGLIEASSMIAIRGLLMESDRLTLLSRTQVEVEIRQGTLGIISFAVPQAPRSIGTTTRRDWEPTATQRRFLEGLRDVCKSTSMPSAAYTKFE